MNFVVSVEVQFYPRYRTYYSLFNDGGVVGDITAAGEEMLAVLNRELFYTALKQLFTTAGIISLEALVMGYLPLGFNDLMHGYFRTLCVGYGLYAVGNTVLLILLYFTDYKGALGAALSFAGAAAGLTALSLRFDPAYYGFGFLAGAAVLFLTALLRLDRFTRWPRKRPGHSPGWGCFWSGTACRKRRKHDTGRNDPPPQGTGPGGCTGGVLRGVQRSAPGGGNGGVGESFHDFGNAGGKTAR